MTAKEGDAAINACAHSILNCQGLLDLHRDLFTSEGAAALCRPCAEVILDAAGVR